MEAVIALYGSLRTRVLSLPKATLPADFERAVTPLLIDAWLDEYARTAATSDIVETRTSGFSYLFDIPPGRLVAAWGISHGRHAGARDKARMAGFPNGYGRNYHRGHAIPHTLGGPTDINLVPQLGRVNIGRFRDLERRAVATVGALYFTHWIYNDATGHKPVRVEQGLLVAGTSADIRIFNN